VGIKEFFASLREKIFSKKKPTRTVAYLPEYVEEIPDAKLKEIGRLKAENMILQQKLKALQLELEKQKKEKTFEDAIINEKKKLMKRERQKIVYLNKIPKTVRVLSKDHKLLGYFHSFVFVEDNGTLGIIVSSKPKDGKKYLVWQGKSMNSLFHHPESISSMVRAGALVLNRDYEGNYIPDVDKLFPVVGADVYREHFLEGEDG